MFKHDFYGTTNVWFVGIVEELIDETYVRARCLGIHSMDRTLIPTEQLPLAMVTYPTTGGQAGSGSISHNLEVDSWVIGFFADYPFCQQPIITATVQGTDYSMSTYDSQGGEFVGEGTGEGEGDSGEVPSGVDENATTNIPGGSNTQKAYNYVYSKLVAEGSSDDPHLHTSALIGVLLLETPGVNPQVVGGYKGRAWGICQWLGERRTQLFRKYGRTKKLSHQLDFMWWELNNTERRAKGLWLRANNLPDAVAGFCMFERAEEVRNGRVNRSHGNFKKRLQYAYQVYNSMKQTGAPSTNFGTDTIKPGV